MTTTETETEGVTAPARSFSGLIALLALLLALLAMAVAVWSNWQLMALDNLPERVSGEEGQLLELNRRVDLLAEDNLQHREDILALRGQLTTGLGKLDNLPATVEQLEQQVLALPGISRRTRIDWLKTEAIYYLRIANAQALLAGDAEVIVSAMRLADEKLRETGDPSVVTVRAALSQEIAALEALPEVDRAGVSFRLQALSTLVDSWPLRAVAPDSFEPDAFAIDPDLSAWERFLATLKRVFASIISVKETDAPPLAQLGAAEQSLIVESVKAELQVSRLAFATGNDELFAGSLARAKAQTELYFDTNAAAVQAALKTLEELQTMEMPGALPDVSRSLSLLLGTSEPQETAAEIVQ